MNGDIKKYQVVSSGEVLKGFSIVGVSESLANLYKIPSSEAIDTLICGKPRKVRSARSKAHAESICAKLQAFGLRCGVSEIRPDTPDDLSMHTHMVSPADVDDIDDDIEPMSESTDAAMASIDAIYKDATSKVAKNKFIKRAGVTLVFLSLIVFGSGYALKQWLLTESAVDVEQIELAMEALSSPSALIFADFAQVRKLSKLSSIVGISDNLQLADLAGISELSLPLSVLKSEFFFTKSNFLNAGVYAESSTISSASIEWLMILNGEFERQQVIRELKSIFDLSSQNEDLFKLALRRPGTIEVAIPSQCSIKSTTQNVDHEWFVAFADDAIIFSSSAELNYRFQSKLTGLKLKSSEASSKLDQWQAYREGSLLSVKAFDPSLLNEHSSTEKFVRSVFGESSFESVSLKVNSALLTQEINASLEFISDDPASLDSAKQALLTNISETQNELSSDFPVINEFLSNLVVDQAGSLMLNAKLDGELIADMNGISADLNSIVNDGVLSKPIKADLLEFKPSTKVWNFDDNVSVLNSIKKQYPRAYQPLYTRQDVDIYVDFIGLKNHENLSQNIVKLTAIKSLPNSFSPQAWAQSGIQQRFSIRDVLNEKGKSLLDEAQCQQNSDLSAKSTLSNDGFLKSSHSMPLLNSVSPNDIHRLKGRYELKVPTKIERRSTSMQANRKVVWADGYLRLSRIQGSTVQYRLLGNTQNLLSVRALNSEGLVLSQQHVQLDDDITTVRFNGRVASLNVFFATEWQSENFDFTLNSVQAKPVKNRNNTTAVKAVVAFGKAERTAFRKRLSTEETLTLFPAASYELGRSKTKTSQLIFNIKLSNNVPSILSGQIIVPFNELLLADNDSLSVYLDINEKYKAEFKPNFKTSKNMFMVAGKRYLKGEFSIKIDKAIEQINNIKGSLKFAMPSKLSRKEATIGRDGKNDLQVLSYDYGSSSGSYYKSKRNSEIVLLTAKTGMAYFPEKRASSVLKFNNFVGEPKQIELIKVSRRNRFSEKFKLTVSN